MKKSIFKRIGLIALAVCVAIDSFFVPVTKKQYNSASAFDNTTITEKNFLSSNLMISCLGNTTSTDFHTLPDFNFSYFLPSSSSIGQGTSYFYLLYTYSFGFSLVSVDGDVRVNYLMSMINFADRDYGLISSSSTNVSDFHNIGFVSISHFTQSENFRLIEMTSADGIRYSSIYIAYISGSSDIPSLDMVSVEIFNGYNNPYSDVLDFSSRIVNSNIVCYTDTTGAKFFFAIPSYVDGSSASDVLYQYYYSYRLYYLKSSLDYSDNQIYEQGYRNGLADNQTNIYNNGYNAGYDIGFGNGVTVGRADANDFSFISLIGAVVDVPLQTFLGLFHFELLGINLANFILALLTVAFIIFIIKLILGSK